MTSFLVWTEPARAIGEEAERDVTAAVLDANDLVQAQGRLNLVPYQFATALLEGRARMIPWTNWRAELSR